MADQSYDVLLSHNSKDKPAVERLAERLRLDGLAVWFDKWNLIPGTPFQQAIEQALIVSNSCAFFVGPDGIGPWHSLEMRAALNQQVTSGRAFRVIPVLLPGAPQPDNKKLPLFLHELTWVTFAAEEDDDAYRRLVCGIRGEAPGFTPKTTMTVGDDRDLKIVPHGLRSFQAEDSRFFLKLLPGTRDHRNLPAGVAFWKDRLEQIDPDSTFSVGLLYGPSGCGKSSLVKAGLMPRLAEYVQPIYVEATPDNTERQLLARLRRPFPALPSDLDLPSAIQYLAEHAAAREGYKAVLVLDQFEQWLHANRIRSDTPLVVALRHCDAGRVQTVLVVRDDFFLATYQFMSAVNVPIVQDGNMKLVDLFNRRHARQVLVEYGRAYGCLPDDVDETSDEQNAFLDRAIDELADKDDKIGTVNIAVFADMMRGKSWTSESLRNVGGAAGVGRTFLEENFDRRTANPAHRIHRKAAMAVLKCLLPESGADIKGAMRPRDELQKASGYQHQDARFVELMRILVNDLRIVSPTVRDDDMVLPDTAAIERPHFQLTHDYIVPSLREWLAAEQKENWRGRALLRLEERSDQWNRDPQTRYLPNIVEFASISLGVSRRKRTVEQRAMMRVATRRFAIQSCVVLAVLLLLGFVGVWFWNDTQDKYAETLVGRVLDAGPAGIPYALENLPALKERVIPKLRERKQKSKDGRRRLHAAIALATLGEVDQSFLLDAIAEGAAGQCANLVMTLEPEKESVIEQIQRRFAAVKSPEKKARYATVALHLGDVQPAKELLALGPDPSGRTAFIHGYPTWHGNLDDLRKLLDQLDVSSRDEADFRSGVCSALGLVDPDEVERAAPQLVQIVKAWYQRAADGPTHSAAGWAHWRWKKTVPEILVKDQKAKQRDWFVLDVPDPQHAAPQEGLGMTMIKVPAGGFQMGSGNRESQDERPMHSVELTRDFYVSDREVTLGMYEAFVADVKANKEYPEAEVPQAWSPKFKIPDYASDCPVHEVSWFDAVKFCNWLSRQHGRTPCFDTIENKETGITEWRCDFKTDGFRLPTEAEWEYACRARTDGNFYFFGDDAGLLHEYAIFSSNSRRRGWPGGRKLPNGFGLFDVHGNVWEWCWDWYGSYPKIDVSDPTGPSSGEDRVSRGGSWGSCASPLRAANRHPIPPSNPHHVINTGFRLLCIFGGRA